MKLLLDECVTRHLKREFGNHEVHTVEQAGFKGLENGHLLKAAKRNSYVRLKPLMPRALKALETIKTGDVVRIEEW